MKAKLTRIHFGLGIPEMGLQFELDDGAGGAVTQRAFVDLPDDATVTAVWAAANAALAAKLSELPANQPPGSVTTVLMAARNARQELEKAQAAKQREEDARAAAEAARHRAEGERAEHEAAAKAAAEKHAETIKALADLDAKLAAKRAELEATHAEPQP